MQSRPAASGRGRPETVPATRSAAFRRSRSRPPAPSPPTPPRSRRSRRSAASPASPARTSDVTGLPKNAATNGWLRRALFRARSCSSARPAAPDRGGRCRTRRARTRRRRSRRSACGHGAHQRRARSASSRSEISIAAMFGQRCCSSGMNVAARRRDAPAARVVEHRQIQDAAARRQLAAARCSARP